MAVSDTDGGLVVRLLDERPRTGADRGRLAAGLALFSAPGRASFTATVEPAADGFVIRHRAAQARVLVLTPTSATMHDRLPEKQAADTSKLVVSPMPGLVVSIEADAGQTVREGEIVCIIEAMKMQNIIRAERDGVVKAVNAAAGDSVAADDVLVEFA